MGPRGLMGPDGLAVGTKGGLNGTDIMEVIKEGQAECSHNLPPPAPGLPPQPRAALAESARADAHGQFEYFANVAQNHKKKFQHPV